MNSKQSYTTPRRLSSEHAHLFPNAEMETIILKTENATWLNCNTARCAATGRVLIMDPAAPETMHLSLIPIAKVSVDRAALLRSLQAGGPLEGIELKSMDVLTMHTADYEANMRELDRAVALRIKYGKMDEKDIVNLSGTAFVRMIRELTREQLAIVSRVKFHPGCMSHGSTPAAKIRYEHLDESTRWPQAFKKPSRASRCRVVTVLNIHNSKDIVSIGGFIEQLILSIEVRLSSISGGSMTSERVLLRACEMVRVTIAVADGSTVGIVTEFVQSEASNRALDVAYSSQTSPYSYFDVCSGNTKGCMAWVDSAKAIQRSISDVVVTNASQVKIRLSNAQTYVERAISLSRRGSDGIKTPVEVFIGCLETNKPFHVSSCGKRAFVLEDAQRDAVFKLFSCGGGELARIPGIREIGQLDTVDWKADV